MLSRRSPVGRRPFEMLMIYIAFVISISFAAACRLRSVLSNTSFSSTSADIRDRFMRLAINPVWIPRNSTGIGQRISANWRPPKRMSRCGKQLNLAAIGFEEFAENWRRLRGLHVLAARFEIQRDGRSSKDRRVFRIRASNRDRHPAAGYPW